MPMPCAVRVLVLDVRLVYDWARVAIEKPVAAADALVVALKAEGRAA